MGMPPGQAAISLEFNRQFGPKYVHGGVTIAFDELQPHSFLSTATWPTSDSYEADVRESIEEVLQGLLGGHARVRVVRTAVKWNEVNSCANGLRRARRPAAQAVFAV